MDMSSLKREAGGLNAAARSRIQQQGRVSTVKNKAPAAVQITAEQLLREAQEFKEETATAPRQQITDPAELREYQGRKRQEFEDGLRRNKQNMGLWMRYGQWEAKLGEFARSRSVYERAIDVDYRNQSMWLKYAEMEMKNRQVNHARNIWDRAVSLLPRVDQFWYKYAYMEEMLGEVDKARVIFERWMTFHPNEQAWLSFIKLELRHHQIERARALYERFTLDQLTLDSYLKYAKFETRYGTVALARSIYERAQDELTDEEKSDEKFYIAFAHFEERNKEYDRARAIYQFALDHLPKHRASLLYDKYVAFEKSFGDKEGIELVILSKKRFQYEEEIKQQADANGGMVHNYDIWFDYLRLEEDRLESIQSSVNPAVNSPNAVSAQCARVRELYERAVANVPLVSREKKYWKRYIYLWLYWLVFEEGVMKDLPRCKEIASKLLGGSGTAGSALIPHEKFTFAKLWLHIAHMELRTGDVASARSRLGEALGRTSHLPSAKLKIFKGYLALELQLGALDRVRTLYSKLVEFLPSRAESWLDFAAFEARLQEQERTRTLYELAVQQAELDQPERIWKAYIEYELSTHSLPAVRALYLRLLDKTKHVRVWISSAQFEAGQREYQKAREVFAKAEEYFKSTQARRADEERVPGSSSALGGGAGGAPSAELLALKEERLALLQSWRDFERTHGSLEQVAEVTKKLPQQLKKRRAILTTLPDGSQVPSGYEEYFDYAYPEESAKAAASGLQLLEKAKLWKKQQEMKQAAEQARLEAEVEREEREREESEGGRAAAASNGGGEDAEMADGGGEDQPGAAAMEQ